MGEEWDDPRGSVWIIGVDYGGILFLVSPPNVWDGFYSEGLEYCGWQEDTDEVGPGVYRVTVDWVGGQDPGTPDDPGDPWWEFTPVKWEPLWQPEASNGAD